MEKLKIAVVGVGGISIHHINSYFKNPNVEVYAFCDINETRLRYMGEKHGITRLYNDEAEMLRELPEIDAVSVCTWNSAHAPCAIMALNAGKHVLCEKPMATSVEEALAMQEAAERNGKLLMIAFVRRFGRDCEVVRDLDQNGALGEIYYAKAINLRRNGHPGGWFGDKSRSGGGPLIDLGVHAIDLVRYLLGKPNVTSVYGATFNKLGDRSNLKTAKAYQSVSAGKQDICDCEDLATATVRFDSGAVLTIDMSFSLNLEEDQSYVQLFGTKGGVKLDDKVRLFSEMNGYMTNVDLYGKTGLDVGDAFAREINNFVSAVMGTAECICPAEDGVELMRILTAIYESAENKHEVVIER